MAKHKVTGKTEEELEAAFEEYNGTRDEFEEAYCLAKIPRLPDDYNGPERFCFNNRTIPTGSNDLCKFHGGKRSDDWNTENLDTLGNMKHGMNATREHLIEDFDEKDEALYNWIVTSFPEAYDIELEDDPQAQYDLHRLAAEIVRAERGRGFLIQEGEVNEEPVRNDEGRVVLDDAGEIVTEKSQHYLADMMHKQDNKITKLERELGISRKERLKRETQEDALEAVTKGFTELGEAFLQRDSKDYDPDEKPWQEEDTEHDND
jgi:hypothetical protein